MIIQKIFNNNAIIASDPGKREFVVMGRGIAFKKSAGEPVDKSLIEKIFVLQQKEASEKFKLLLEDVPPEYISVCYDIIEYGKNNLEGTLSDYIYVTLTDHLNNAMKMYEEGIFNTNPLSWEIRRFYPKEYKVGVKALEFIESTLGKTLPEDEAANIALHLVNAELNGSSSKFHNVAVQAEKIQDILNIIKYTYNIELDEQSISYERFITHLKFFFQRLMQAQKRWLEDDFLLQQVKSKYRRAYDCMLKIEKYLDTELTDEEKLYLTIHIQRITSDTIE
ncbi:BglG family transcription antiterminator LicT [Paenibacillus hunanensis]|uniref:Beta-glucoside operon transcriptional antiterminator n=1 Tax=Paenibacillus hunanensis TaxID=539262 RepID=A0ABU1IZ81_9BACL|nr:PRD domain-containing protein [Paenibacillus hunanensis]MCL9659063.1 PRD domain-containing protein [Paenibacillus hunanensis]MDR6244571.1 beta-glucoside operon transcriptional antiterminator [Paenibacillus hunanensis]GGJ00465.1 transcription antiterminator BglG [Paenibacillus hunanensis]